MMNDPNRMYAPPAAPTGAQAEMLPITADGVVYAGFGVRVGARIIDSIIGMILGGIGGAIGGALSAVVQVANGAAVDVGRQSLGAQTAVSLLFGAAATLAYHTLSEGLGSTTLGKLMLGLRVRRSDLGPCTVGAALGRSLAYYIDSFFFGLVAYSSMSKSPRQQRLGDKWAHTVVVRSASLPAGAPAGNVGLGIALAAMAHVALSAAGLLSKLLF
jgi:uncharacterized RDD family membrane protein YckC